MVEEAARLGHMSALSTSFLISTATRDDLIRQSIKLEVSQHGAVSDVDGSACIEI